MTMVTTRVEMEEDSFHSLPSSSLLPPLPNHLALLCLARLPRVRHGLLRCVNSTWNRALSSPPFFRHRALHGSADTSVLAIFEHHIPMGAALPVQCVEVDLASGANSRLLASWTHEQATQIFLRGQACIQTGPAVLFTGGYAWHKEEGGGSSLKPTDRMWWLCMLTWKVWGAASMSVPRASFAWAVFGGDLVVVAGGECAPGEWTMGAEAYCSARDEWVPLALMPVRVKIQYYFVQSGRLLIGGKAVGGGGPGGEMVLAYDPTSGTWACLCPEPWMRSLCCDTCCAAVATNDAIVCTSLHLEATFFTDELFSTCLRVSRLCTTPQKPSATTTTTTATTTVVAAESPEWETISILDRVCTSSIFSLHSTVSSAILVLPYDLSPVNYYCDRNRNRNHNPDDRRTRRVGTAASDIVILKSLGALGLVQVCVRCCYCFRCHLSSALITL